MSKNGALLSVAKAGRTVDGLTALLASRVSQNTFVGEIVAPLASQAGRKRKNQDEETSNPSKQRRPELPATGIRSGGQSSASATFIQFIARTTLNSENKVLVPGRDPREDLFKYHDDTEQSGEKPLLAEKTAEEEEEDRQSNKT